MDNKDDEEQATLDSQFSDYSKLFDQHRDGTTITLYRSDYWMRQAMILDDRNVTMTDTGILFNEYCKSEIDWDEWLVFLSKLCQLKGLDEDEIKDLLTKCGAPGITPVTIPQFRDFFLTYEPKKGLVVVEDTA